MPAAPCTNDKLRQFYLFILNSKICEKNLISKTSSLANLGGPHDLYRKFSNISGLHSVGQVENQCIIIRSCYWGLADDINTDIFQNRYFR